VPELANGGSSSHGAVSSSASVRKGVLVGTTKAFADKGVTAVPSAHAPVCREKVPSRAHAREGGAGRAPVVPLQHLSENAENMDDKDGGDATPLGAAERGVSAGVSVSAGVGEGAAAGGDAGVSWGARTRPARRFRKSGGDASETMAVSHLDDVD